MNREEEAVLRTFETRVRQLILQYKTLEEENQRLRSVMDGKERELQQAKDECARLENAYANLKLAKMLEINDSDLRDAKSRLAKLIRDVDKCIALLNV